MAKRKILSSRRIWAARIIAILADTIQIVLLPAFAPGLVSPADDVLDGAVAVILMGLVGWHWALLPAAAAELLPTADLVPFWTMGVLLATRNTAPVPVLPEKTGG